MYASIKHSIGVVTASCTLEWLGKVALFSQRIDVDRMEPIATIRKAFNFIGLVSVSLRCEVPGISVWIDPAICQLEPNRLGRPTTDTPVAYRKN